VRREFAGIHLPSSAPRFDAGVDEAGNELVKLSAAGLIDHAGVKRGFALPGSGAAISSKHTLAITNHDGASAEQIAELARYVRARVLAEFGVELIPEPNLIGLEL
jgi:UDP-N-acetylmuramate dehydrogenase